MGDDEELRARIEARIAARRAQQDLPADPATESAGAGTPDTAAAPASDPVGPTSGTPLKPVLPGQARPPKPKRPWDRSPTEDAPDMGNQGVAAGGIAGLLDPARPWLSGTAPSVREANLRAAELHGTQEEDAALGTAASLRPSRPWLREPEERREPNPGLAASTVERRIARRPPVSFVPPPENTERMPDSWRERRQRRRAEKTEHRAERSTDAGVLETLPVQETEAPHVDSHLPASATTSAGTLVHTTDSSSAVPQPDEPMAMPPVVEPPAQQLPSTVESLSAPSGLEPGVTGFRAELLDLRRQIADLAAELGSVPGATSGRPPAQDAER